MPFFPRPLSEIRSKSLLKSGENLRENRFSFPNDRHIRDAGSEKKGMVIGHFRAAGDDLYRGKILPDPPQEMKGALNIPQIEGAADDVGLPVEDLFEQMPIIE